jgi:hypothetical protein
LIKFTFTATSARISYPVLSTIAMDPTDAFHTYRIQNLGGSHIQVLVDGESQLDIELTASGGGTEGITIGDLGGCGGSAAVWEYLAYDTAAPGTEADDTDGDGIEAAVDLCPAIADIEQLDTDSDRVGDECDACPSDPLNDYDDDGLCADEDICPQSADNADSNANGICDSDECLNGGLPGGLPVAIAAPCLPGTSPNCCPFYGMDPVLPPPTGGTAGANSGGATTVGPAGGANAGGASAGGASAGGSVAAGSSSATAGSTASGSVQRASNTNSSGTCSLSLRGSMRADEGVAVGWGALWAGTLILARRRRRLPR